MTAVKASAGAEMQKESLYDLLRRRIIRFELLPGETLSENTLAAELGVSRSPVRDALARLAANHCVIVYPQRGTQVAHISMERVQQAIFLRTTLEHSTLKEICHTGLTPAQLEELQASIRLQREHLEHGRENELLEEDTRMHRMLYAYCGHESAWAAFDTLNCDLMRLRYLQIRTFSYKTTMAAVDSWENSLTEHRMMLDALRKRDAEAVCLLSSHHIGNIGLVGESMRRIYPQYFAEDEE